MHTPRIRAALLAAAFVASVAWSSPVIAAPAAIPPEAPLAPASTTIPFSATATDPVAEGVQRRHGRWTTTAGPQVVELIDVDPAAPGISLEVSGPAAGPNALETVRSQAARVSRDGHRVIAAINGDTFRPWTRRRAPAGLRSTSARSSRAHDDKPTLGFDAERSASWRRVTSRVDNVAGRGHEAHHRPSQQAAPKRRPRAVHARWGSSTHTPTGGAEVVLTGAALPLRVKGPGRRRSPGSSDRQQHDDRRLARPVRAGRRRHEAPRSSGPR
jgi:hypothetical protein